MKAYRLFRLDEDYQLIVIKSKGLLKVYKREEYDEIYRDTLWLDDAFQKIVIIMKSGARVDNKYCYVLLIDENGSHRIMELVSRKRILSEYQYNHLKIVHKEIEHNRFSGSEILDVTYRVFNKKKKVYALYSLKEGYLFAPYKYDKIDVFCCGVILDDHIAVENNGEVINLANYERKDYDIFIRKDKERYMLLLDQEGFMFYFLQKDDLDDNILIAETEHKIYKYDLSTEECMCETKRFDHEIDWREYNDIAYEGHNRLELGLED